ncbi:hypothetical protein P5673_009226 [Acropora cervicornis]|uniref:Uncharacterized protein n=1 Tax=Acropora cervicornis TaxID=6130 RepID=A0AAD9QSI8_ACRCE|nr:hypothetical protein P5673_009226 [Acropora cervicornis]
MTPFVEGWDFVETLGEGANGARRYVIQISPHIVFTISCASQATFSRLNAAFQLDEESIEGVIGDKKNLSRGGVRPIIDMGKYNSDSMLIRIGELYLQLPKLIRIDIAIKFLWASPRGHKPSPNSGLASSIQGLNPTFQVAERS